MALKSNVRIDLGSSQMDDEFAYGVSQCRFVEYQSILDPRGALGVIEEDSHVPFRPKRLYYITGVPIGADRGAHAHKKLEQFFFVPKGSVDIEIDDGRNTREIHLTDEFAGFYMCPMIWRNLRNFYPGTVLCVLASERYEESDYIRSYEEFRRLTST